MSDRLDEAWEEAVHAALAFENEEEAIRAFGLAVLEATVAKVTHDNDMGAFECDACAWGVHDLRQQIEALGKEARDAHGG